MVFWLYSLFQGDVCYEKFLFWMHCWSVKMLLFVWSGALFFHLFNGIRHLAWDMGWGYELKQVYTSGYAVLVLTALATVIFWGMM